MQIEELRAFWDQIEPAASQINAATPAEQAAISTAISLKRIADHLERQEQIVDRLLPRLGQFGLGGE